jgi:hypothetical protein
MLGQQWTWAIKIGRLSTPVHALGGRELDASCVPQVAAYAAFVEASLFAGLALKLIVRLHGTASPRGCEQLVTTACILRMS